VALPLLLTIFNAPLAPASSQGATHGRNGATQQFLMGQNFGHAPIASMHGDFQMVGRATTTTAVAAAAVDVVMVAWVVQIRLTSRWAIDNLSLTRNLL